MSSNETNTPLEDISTALRAVTKLRNDAQKSDGLTLDMLASALKLAALPIDDQEKLTPASINAAIRLAAKISNEQQQEPQQHASLSPESLAIVLKLATKTSLANDNDDQDKNDLSANQMLTAMKATVAITQVNQSHDPVTSDLLSDALKLANN